MGLARSGAAFLWFQEEPCIGRADGRAAFSASDAGTDPAAPDDLSPDSADRMLLHRAKAESG